MVCVVPGACGGHMQDDEVCVFEVVSQPSSAYEHVVLHGSLSQKGSANSDANSLFVMWINLRDIIASICPAKPSAPAIYGPEYIEACATGARSTSTASASRTSPRTRRSATPRAMIARLYDALHDPKKRNLAAADRHRQRQRTRFFQAPKTLEDMVGSRDAIAEWAQVTYWLDGPHARLQGGVPGARSAPIRLLPAVPGERAALVQVQPGSACTFVNHAIVNPPVDRNKPAGRRRATCTCTSRRRPTRGLIVSGRERWSRRRRR